jgi:CYTH domain-containing protein
VSNAPEPSNVEVELELTYLASKLPAEINGVSPSVMFDIYLPEDSPRPFIRLRQKGGKYEITKKKPINDNDLSAQTEQTIPLDEDEFTALSVASKRSVQKNRYAVDINGYPAEVDVFTENFAGLVLIDFEFKTLAEKQAFQPPDCCLAEVTQEWFIAGGQLAGKSYEDIAADLDRFNYKPL